MLDTLLECPSADYPWTIRDRPEFTAHVNENHSGKFQRDDWLTFSNPESAQFQSRIRKDRMIGEDSENDEA